MTADVDPPSPPPPTPSSVPGWTPPAPSQPASGGKRRGIRKRWIVLVVVVAFGGLGLFLTWQQEQNYQAGHAAYLTADCATAIGPLRSAADGPGSNDTDAAMKAKAELQECDALLAADDLATKDKDGDAVLAYSEFVTKYPQGPLRDAALAKGQSTIARAPDQVATLGVCDALDALEAQQFITAPTDTLPPLLYACGQAFEANKEYAEALAAYARFRTDYPDHGLAADVDAAVARATLAETDESGAGSLPPPQQTGQGSGAAGVATIVIQNDSPDRLSMVFSGPDVRVEELESCAGCVKYTGTGPDACPDLGPIGEYVVTPGMYEVVVKSGSGSDVIPFRGTWTLEAGESYDSCFYIVSGP